MHLFPFERSINFLCRFQHGKFKNFFTGLSSCSLTAFSSICFCTLYGGE